MKGKIIPKQMKGASTDTYARVVLPSVDEAKKHFQLVRSRLMHVSSWKELAGGLSADFQLIDPDGKEVSREARIADRFRIDLPAPSSDSGDGYDWVEIEQIEDIGDEQAGSEYLAIKVKPSQQPGEAPNKSSHFFSEDASSTFVVRRKFQEVIAEVHGRNEEPNAHTLTFLGKVRNIFVALGAMMGFSKVQWKSLVNALVKV